MTLYLATKMDADTTKRTAMAAMIAAFTGFAFLPFFFRTTFRMTAPKVTATEGRSALRQKSIRMFEPVPAIGEMMWKTIWSNETSGQTYMVQNIVNERRANRNTGRTKSIFKRIELIFFMRYCFASDSSESYGFPDFLVFFGSDTDGIVAACFNDLIDPAAA